MSNEKFKVKFGLAVGDTQATIDGTTGDIVTTGDIDVRGGQVQNSTGSLEIISTGANNLTINPGSGTTINDGHMILGELNTLAILTTNGTGDLHISTSGAAAQIALANGANGNIFLTPNGTGTVIVSSDLAVNGATSADITTTTTTGTVFNATASIVKLGEAATTVSIGANTGTTTINNSLVADDISVTTVDTTNLEVTNIKARDGTAAMTIADSTGIVTVSTQLQVDNINISTNTISSTDTNGNITLDPNGTGNVVLTFANGGNLTNDRNYVFGAIRNATTAGIGDIWAVNASTTFQPLRGISIDNSGDTTKLPGLVLRTYNATGTNRGRIVLERARGTSASPAAVQSGDFLGEISASGYSSTGWVNDTVSSATGFFGFTASEAWVSNTALGTNFALSLAPQTTTISSAANLVTCLAIRPESAVLKGDQFAISRAKTSAFVATGCSTATSVLTIGTVTSGAPAIGQVVQSSTLGFLNSTYIVSNVSGSGSGSVWNISSIPGTLSSLTVTGQTGFIGSPSAATTVDALADLRLLSNAIKGSGGTTQITTSSAGAILALAGDTITLENAAGTDYAVLNSTSATFYQPVGFPVYTAAGKPATGVVGQQIAISNSGGGGNPNGMMAFWDTTNARWSYIHDNSAV